MSTFVCSEGYFIDPIGGYCSECIPLHYCLKDVAIKCPSGHIASKDKLSCTKCKKGTYPAADSDFCVGTTSTERSVPYALIISITAILIAISGVLIFGLFWSRKKVKIVRNAPQLKYDDMILPPALLAPAPSPEFDYDNKDLID